MKNIVSIFLFASISLSATAGVLDDLNQAMTAGDVPAVMELLGKGVDVNSTDAEGNTLTMRAARDGQTELVARLLQMRPRLHLRNRHGDDALMLAAFKGHLAIVRLLAGAGAPIDHPGWTPLMYAAFSGHEEVVRDLLERGAQVDAEGANGITALMLAARNGHKDVVWTLLMFDADPRHESADGGTAMQWAAAARHTDIVDMLKAIGVGK